MAAEQGLAGAFSFFAMRFSCALFRGFFFACFFASRPLLMIVISLFQEVLDWYVRISDLQGTPTSQAA
ncbi:hypothetical protein I0D68_17300 [Pseudomonas lalucatii]|nr:hypothetical protein I0D68_17300 [Pseudomonas lalucatii]